MLPCIGDVRELKYKEQAALGAKNSWKSPYIFNILVSCNEILSTILYISIKYLAVLTPKTDTCACISSESISNLHAVSPSYDLIMFRSSTRITIYENLRVVSSPRSCYVCVQRDALKQNIYHRGHKF